MQNGSASRGHRGLQFFFSHYKSCKWLLTSFNHWAPISVLDRGRKRRGGGEEEWRWRRWMRLLIRKQKTTESFSQSLPSFKSPHDRKGENDKAEVELSPPSQTQSLLPVCSPSVSVCVCLWDREGREIIAKHFLPKTLQNQSEYRYVKPQLLKLELVHGENPLAGVRNRHGTSSFF